MILKETYKVIIIIIIICRWQVAKTINNLWTTSIASLTGSTDGDERREQGERETEIENRLSVGCHQTGLGAFGAQDVGSVGDKAFAHQRGRALRADETVIMPMTVFK